MERKIKLAIDSNPENIPLLAGALNKLCSLVPLSDVESYQIEVSAVEAVNNAIEHAYDNKPGYGIEVVFTLYPDKLTLDICDFGRMMEHETQSSLEFTPSDLKSLPERGMGLFVMKSVMDEVDYRSDQGKNILRMTKFLIPKGRR
jgi:serine/threonine-protein kinase RsbW